MNALPVIVPQPAREVKAHHALARKIREPARPVYAARTRSQRKAVRIQETAPK